MNPDNEVVNPSIRERSDQEPSPDPLPAGGSQATNATGNAPTEGDEGGAGTEDTPQIEPEAD